MIASAIRRAGSIGVAIICLAGVSCARSGLRTIADEAPAAPQVRVAEDGTVHVPAFDLPESSFLSEETRTALRQTRDRRGQEAATPPKACPPPAADTARMPAIRRCEAEAFSTSWRYKAMRDRYPATITPQVMGGVYTEVFTPAAGIAPQ